MPKAKNPNLADELMNAAMTYIDTHGRADFSMKTLASQIGYAVTAVYRCFENRAQLLQQIQMNYFMEFSEHFIGIHDVGDEVIQVHEMGIRFVSWASENPHRYRFMFQDTDALLSEEDQYLARSALTLLASIIESGKAAGRFDVQSPSATATMLFASLHGLVSLYLAERLDNEIVPSLAEFYETHSLRWIDALLMAHPPAVRP